MYSSRQIDFAKMSLRAYDYDEKQRFGVPDGWEQVDRRVWNDTGFQAVVFRNAQTHESVIAFTGTRFADNEPLNVDWNTNIAGFMGNIDAFGGGRQGIVQFADATRYVGEIMGPSLTINEKRCGARRHRQGGNDAETNRSSSDSMGFETKGVRA